MQQLKPDTFYFIKDTDPTNDFDPLHVCRTEDHADETKGYGFFVLGFVEVEHHLCDWDLTRYTFIEIPKPE